MSYRRETAAAPVVGSGRNISFILSTGGVARDGHTINQAGWDLAPYLANPVVTFAHDTSALPIGRMVTIGVKDGALRGTAEFADAAANPQADCVYRLLVGKYLNAASISWDPIEFRYSSDPKRAQGAIDFIRQQLLECAVVPLPSDPACLVTARSRGINTAPLADWADRLLGSGTNNVIGRQALEALSRAARPTRTVHDLGRRTLPRPARNGRAISDNTANVLKAGMAHVRSAHDHLRSVNANIFPDADPLAPIDNPDYAPLADDRSRARNAAADNETLMRRAHDHLHAAHDCMRAIMKSAPSPVGSGLEDAAGEARAARELRVRKLRLAGLAQGL